MFKKPLGLLGIFLVLVGIGYFAGAGVAYSKVQGGYDSLQAFSKVQNVELSYNDDGQLVDRGEVEGGQAIRSLLDDDWKFPIVESDLDPSDPLVNTATEFMYQMATISFHTLHGTQTVTLTEGDLTGDDGTVATEYDCNGEMVAVPTPSPLMASPATSRSTAATGPDSTARFRCRPRLVTWPGAAPLTLSSPSSVSVPQRTAPSSSHSESQHCWPASAWSAP